MSGAPNVFEPGIAPIRSLPREQLALDHARLFRAGLEHVKRLSALVWTDHNFHDPGVTQLELLCFALTDLAYRASLPIADRSAGEARFSTLFPAHEMLPAAPLTPLDYRQLLVDCEGVANAWLRPAPEIWHVSSKARRAFHAERSELGTEPVTVRGGWDVWLDLTPEGQRRRDAVIEEAKRRLAAARNLGEDFRRVLPVERDRFRVCAEIEVEPGANLAQTAANALRAVRDTLAPPLPRYSLAQRLAMRPAGKPAPIEEIFAGPLPTRGFVLSEDLERSELPSMLQLSDVYRALQSVPGVIALRDVILRATRDEPANGSLERDPWFVAVLPDHKPELDLETSRIVFYKRGIPLQPDPDELAAALAALDAEEAARIPRGTPVLEPVPARARALARYTSFQNHFPAVYGLSADGPQRPQSREDEQATRDLKAYLLFFDQLFANFLAQLAAAPRLLSSDPELKSTYFVQAVTSFRDWEHAYKLSALASTPTETDEEMFARQRDEAARLAAEAFAADAAFARRQRFLDHLTARFAESFHELAWVLHEKFGHSQEALARAKCAFLADVPRLSRERGLGANFGAAQRGASGFERRLAALLDLPQPLRTSLAALDYDVFEIVREQPKEADGERVWFGFRVRKLASGELLFWSTDAYAADSGVRADAAPDERAAALRRARAAAHALAERALLRTLHLLRNAELAAEADAPGRGGPVVLDAPAEIRFAILDERGSKLAIRKPFPTREAASAAIAEARALAGEGLFVIENLELRPRDDDDPAPCLCVEPTCEGCESHDPYSFRIQVILPADAGRFRDMDFRRFAEQTIRDETPAHLLPKICWLGREEMLAFEAAHAGFRALAPETPRDTRVAVLAALIDSLWSVRSVYPESRLNESSRERSADPFLIDRGRLGSGQRE